MLIPGLTRWLTTGKSTYHHIFRLLKKLTGMSILFACKFVHQVRAWYVGGQKRVVSLVLGLDLQTVVELLCGCWGILVLSKIKQCF